MEGVLMDQAKNDEAKDAGTHLLHGVEDIGDVLGHGVAGTVKGVADGVESISAENAKRKTKSD
jgi:hypothetical protein